MKLSNDKELENRMFDEITYVPLEKIDLDDDNPRLGHIIDKLTSDSLIEEYILDEEDGRRLFNQLRKDGCLFEEVWLVRKGDRFIVKEGNRRIVVSRKIIRDIENGKITTIEASAFNKIPAKIFKEKLSEKEIDSFLGSVHIVGKKDWKPSNKGKHIHKMAHKYDEDLEDVADELGMTLSSVKKAYKAFLMTEKYGKKFNKIDIAKYSYFDEVYKSNVLVNFVDDPDSLNDLFDWIHDKKITNHRDMRKLLKIISAEPEIRKKCLQILNSKNGLFEDAYHTYTIYNESSNWAVVEKLRKILDAFPIEQIKIAKDDLPKQTSLKKLIKSAKELQKSILTMDGAKSI